MEPGKIVSRRRFGSHQVVPPVPPSNHAGVASCPGSMVLTSEIWGYLMEVFSAKSGPPSHSAQLGSISDSFKRAMVFRASDHIPVSHVAFDFE